MAKKASKSKKDNKNLIIGICVAVLVVAAIVVAVVLATRNTLNDDYFVSDGSKYVITYDDLESDGEGDQYRPVKIHTVWTYKGDEITSLKMYYVYNNANDAKAAFDAMKEDGEEVKGVELNGKYIIISAEEDTYKDTTASDVKQQIEDYEKAKENIDSIEEGSEVEVEEVEK